MKTLSSIIANLKQAHQDENLECSARHVAEILCYLDGNNKAWTILMSFNQFGILRGSMDFGFEKEFSYCPEVAEYIIENAEELEKVMPTPYGLIYRLSKAGAISPKADWVDISNEPYAWGF